VLTVFDTTLVSKTPCENDEKTTALTCQLLQQTLQEQASTSAASLDYGLYWLIDRSDRHKNLLITASQINTVWRNRTNILISCIQRSNT